MKRIILWNPSLCLTQISYSFIEIWLKVTTNWEIGESEILGLKKDVDRIARRLRKKSQANLDGVPEKGALIVFLYLRSKGPLWARSV